MYTSARKNYVDSEAIRDRMDGWIVTMMGGGGITRATKDIPKNN